MGSSPTPTSLLWAHQLRREHIALVSSLSALESSTATSITSATIVLTNRLDKLESVLNEIRVELDEIKQLVGELQTRQDEIGRKVKAEVEGEIIAGVREEVRILREMVEALMKGRGKSPTTSYFPFSCA
jgi:hypothetical protein